jgi:hypothetical protein
MTKQNPKQVNPDEALKKADKDSKTLSSAEEQINNIPQSTKNAAEENKPVSQQGQGKSSESLPEQTTQSTPDILGADVSKIFGWLEQANHSPRQLKGLLDSLDTRIELIDQSEKTKRIPGVDRRIETLDLFDDQVETSDRYLSGLGKIKLQTELTNLREKRYQVWQKFVKACGSEKKALRYQNLRAKAKSEYYHNKSSYFVKQRILKILNSITQSDQKPFLVDLKLLADHSSGDGLKKFNEGMRDLLDDFDEDLVILCSHKYREKYYTIIRLTLLQWNPESESEIEKLVDADDSE